MKKYQQSTGVSPALLRYMYKFLTNDSSGAENTAQAAIDQRVEDVLELNDADVAWDLQRLNGNPDSTKFDTFWDEVEKYFHERDLAVHERRHGSQLYLPYAISIDDLVSTVRGRVDPEVLIPSNEWVRLQFWPANPTTRTAFHYTGRFNVKFSLQTRQIHGKHEDSHYVASQLVYLKKFAVKLREHVDFFWLDDKAIVPIGEPGLPVSTGVRPHNASLSSTTASSLTALDHDYNVSGAIPSVALHCDIPHDASDSFFNGTAFVTVKDKVSSPSSAIRHGAETTNIIKSHFSADDVNSEKAILIMYTDGGPDHRTTFGSVQLAMIAMFAWLDLDMLITARRAPMGSWANLAERVNSVLNLALQNVSLERERMTEDLEMKMKRVSTLKTARDIASRYPAFKEGLTAAVLPVLKLLEERFSQLKVKGDAVIINSAANNESVENFFGILKDHIDDKLDMNKLTKKDLEKSDKLNDFMDRHCRCRQYIFQIKKCDPHRVDDCWYCVINLPRLPDDEFEQLNFIPDPVVSPESGDKFEEFHSVYGTDTTDSARPSLSSVTMSSIREKQNRKILTANKVRESVTCVECRKPRCVYSDTRLSCKDKTALIRMREGRSYTCGSPLFPPASPYFETLVVKESLRCSSTMETTYYASNTCSLPSVCFHCGIARSEDFADDSVIHELQAMYSTVKPICRSCKQSGKEAAVRGKRNVKKLRTS
ncbi:uncharacterized protein LOC124122725 [Haliotis rufescens]|uniref:uncharacterized protein LOC124122725 n=1 Tax=Haliotis rufescens TaxID=6454 RepID=UPI00201F9805|nr:uncharacterized protein LOC124122725 [Haliotis rufescens]XP_046341797.2 uncharacterized protein LOC124122725 [Haliotis rufescens]